MVHRSPTKTPNPLSVGNLILQGVTSPNPGVTSPNPETLLGATCPNPVTLPEGTSHNPLHVPVFTTSSIVPDALNVVTSGDSSISTQPCHSAALTSEGVTLRSYQMSSPPSDTWKCPVCHSGIEASYTLECFDCKNSVHYNCTRLPMYQIFLLAKTSRRYTCEPCMSYYVKDNAHKTWIENAESSKVRHAQHIGTAAETTGTACYPRTSSTNTLSTRTTNVLQTTTFVPPLSGPSNSLSESQRPSSGLDGSNRSGIQRAQNANVCEDYIKRKCNKRSRCAFDHPDLCPQFMRGGNRENGCDRRPNECPNGRHPHICNNSFNLRECMTRDCKYRHLPGTRTLKNSPVFGSRNQQEHPTYEQGPRLLTRTRILNIVRTPNVL